MNDETPVTITQTVKCPDCGGRFPVLKMPNDQIVVVQPIPIQVVAPARGLIQTNRPISPELACRKALEHTMEVKPLPPVFIPHAYCCPRGGEMPRIFLSLDMLGTEVSNDPEPEREKGSETHEGASDNLELGGSGPLPFARPPRPDSGTPRRRPSDPYSDDEE